MSTLHPKVTADHRRRTAFLYVRQSTLRQVLQNQESTRRQYALRERALALGWPPRQIVVIDTDLGQSGASADREGFRRLVAEVGMGAAGIVLGLEVSRLARNNTDWHRLLELCALTDTLILDEDGIYNPADFNDRLLLGLKGTMSEAELHLLRSRLRGGIQSRARRGELRIALPIGLVYDPQDRVVLDPDAQVRETVQALFDAYQRSGSAGAVLRFFRDQNLLFPRRPQHGPRRGEVLWEPLQRSRVLRALKNPRYAGAFSFGRTRRRRLPDGRVASRQLPRADWEVLLLDAHPGFLSWKQFEANQRRLAEAAAAFRSGRRGPPREGPALLQGLVLCGRCGRRMTVAYHTRGDQRLPRYLCRRPETAAPPCQSIPGTRLDQAVGRLLVELVSPLSLETALRVQDELAVRADETHALRQRHAQRAAQEAELARRRFLRVDPDNRLVAAQLEADWNARLAEQQAALQDLERRRTADQTQLDPAQRQTVLALASDFPKLWNDPKTPHRERTRMARLLIQDVTITRNGQISLGLRLRGGAARTLTVQPDPPAWEQRRTPATLLAEIDQLLEHHSEAQAASILNRRGRTSGTGLPLNPRRVANLCRRHRLQSRFQRLRAQGWLSSTEIAARLRTSPEAIRSQRRLDLLHALPYGAEIKYLYQPPDQYPTPDTHTTSLSPTTHSPTSLPHRHHEAQSDA